MELLRERSLVLSERLTPTVFTHTVSAIGVVSVGAMLMYSKKGTKKHVYLGRIWCGLMYTTCFSSYGITNRNGSFSWIHFLSSWTIFSVSYGIYCIHHKNLEGHIEYMRGSLIGAAVAGLFAIFQPGRSLNFLIFGKA